MPRSQKKKTLQRALECVSRWVNIGKYWEYLKIGNRWWFIVNLLERLEIL